MGRYIVKTGDDEYIEMSSVTDSPSTYFCTREEMVKYLDEPRRGEFWMREGEAEKLIAEVDERLTSDRIGHPPEDYDDALEEIVNTYNMNRTPTITVQRFREKFTWERDDE